MSLIKKGNEIFLLAEYKKDVFELNSFKNHYQLCLE